MMAMRSPGPATTRLMNVWEDAVLVGAPHGAGWPVPWLGLPHTPLPRSAPCGGWKTTMSPTLGWLISRLVSTRWPIFSVGIIEPLGMRYGLTTKAWMSSASATATATVITSSTSDLTGDREPPSPRAIRNRRGGSAPGRSWPPGRPSRARRSLGIGTCRGTLRRRRGLGRRSLVTLRGRSLLHRGRGLGGGRLRVRHGVHRDLGVGLGRRVERGLGRRNRHRLDWGISLGLMQQLTLHQLLGLVVAT